MPTELWSEATLYEVTAQCPQCGGELRFRSIIPGVLARYMNACSRCGYKEVCTCPYPHIAYRTDGGKRGIVHVTERE